MILIKTLMSLSCAAALLAGTGIAQTPATPPGSAGVRLDGSSERAHKASVERAKRSMSAADRERLNRSLELARRMFGDAFLKRVHGAPANKVKLLHDMVAAELDTDGDGEIDDRELLAARDKLKSAARRANEMAAIATLKNLASAQAQTRAMGVIDVDGNGQGEYGYFAEMAGVIGLRTDAGEPGRTRMSPPVLSRSFEVRRGLVERSGYLYQVWLPNAEGRAVAEGQRGGVGQFPPDPAQAAHAWCAYAWPVDYGESGSRAFFVDQDGEVYETDNEKQRYAGRRRPPSPYAAYQLGAEKLGSMPRRNQAHNDRGAWAKVR